MTGRKSILGLLTLVLLAAAPSLYAQAPRFSGFVDEFTLARYGMVRRWYTQVPILRHREKIISLKQQENLLFAASDKGLLHCLDAESGELLWTQTASEVEGEVFPPALTKTSVFVTSGSRLMQLDRATGRIILTKTLESGASSGPGANEDFCYVQTIDHYLNAIFLKTDPDDTFRVWPYKRRYTLPYVKWHFNAGSDLKNPPIVLPDRVIFTSANGVVFASVLSERNLFYRYIPGSKIAAPVSHREKTLYVATEDFNLYAVDLITGNTIWRFPSGYPIHRQPVPFAEDVYLTPEDGGLFSLSTADGSLNWVNEAASRVVSVSQTRVYAMSPTWRFLILDRADGATLGSWMSMDLYITAYNQTSDRIFQATERGLITCLAEKANEQPFLHITPPVEEEKPAEEDKAPKQPADPPMDGDAPEEGDEAKPEPGDEGEPADESEEMEKPEEADEEMERPEDDGEMEAPDDAPAEEGADAEPSETEEP